VNFNVPLTSQRPISTQPAQPEKSIAERYLALMSSYASKNDGLRTVEYGEQAVKVDPTGIRTLIQVSRAYAGLQGQTTQMDKALKHAEKALTLARDLKSQQRSKWAAEMEASAQQNLAWVQQVEAWQRRALFSAMTPTRR
jgi:tetratricopeptide (TPR) repeat protein